MTNKEIREAIKEEFSGKPENEISFGVFLHTVGYKYVTIMDCHGTTTLERIPLATFDGIGEEIDNGFNNYTMKFSELLSDYRDNC